MTSLANGWRDRWNAVKRLPAVFVIVWEAGSFVVLSGVVFRLIFALIPLAVLAISRKIIDAIVAHVTHQNALPPMFWWLVAAEFALAMLAGVLGRAIDFTDSLLADRFTRHVSVRVMDHAARLDLQRYEDPVFYDKLERARVQATDRTGMIRALGMILQQGITAVTLSAGIFPFLALAVAAARALRGAGFSG